MHDEHGKDGAASRRDFLRATAASAAALAMGGDAFAASTVGDAVAAPSAKPDARHGGAARAGAYNILLILVDQERFFRSGELPPNFELPAHERLVRNGTAFVNHRINSCVCTPSRSVVYTGRHIQQTKMFDNTNFPWIGSLSPDIRTDLHQSRFAPYLVWYDAPLEEAMLSTIPWFARPFAMPYFKRHHL